MTTSRFLGTLMAVSVVLIGAGVSQAVELRLDITVDEGAKTWLVTGTIDDPGATDGLQNLFVNIVGTGLTVETSQTELPGGTDVFFDGTNFATQAWGFNDGRNDDGDGPGVEVGAGQNVVVWPDGSIVRGIGTDPGTRTSINPFVPQTPVDWGVPLVIASGTYSGGSGTLTASGLADECNLLAPGFVQGMPGGSFGATVVPASVDVGGTGGDWQGPEAQIVVDESPQGPDITPDEDWGQSRPENQTPGWNNPDRVIKISLDLRGENPPAAEWEKVEFALEGGHTDTVMNDGTDVFTLVVALGDLGVDLSPGGPFAAPFGGQLGCTATLYQVGVPDPQTAQMSIFVPEPTSLGLLALGCVATLLRRRRK